MARVSLTINEIRQMQRGTRCLVGRDHMIHFARPISSSERIQITATMYDTEATVEGLPDKFLQAATYFVLARYYAEVDPTRSNYYNALYHRAWVATRSNRQYSGRQDYGRTL